MCFFFFSSRRRHTRYWRDWSSDVCSSDLQATITLGVTTEAPTAAEAMRLNAAKMSQVIAALKKGGIADRDLQTSGLNLNPQYVYQENLPPRLNGYQASNQVTVVVRDLAKHGQAVDAAVNSGATNVGGVAVLETEGDAADV